MSKSIDEAILTMEANIKAKTGRSVPEWVKVAKNSGHDKHGQIVKFLKSQHGITHGYANLIAHRALQTGSDQHGDDDLVAAQYAGEKAALRPIYDKLLKSMSAFGKELEVAPKKTYVSLRRKKQFALIQPSTKTRVDLGINLKGRKPEGRLESSGSFNAMVSHRVKLESAREVDAEVVSWLKAAFEAAG